MRYFSLFILAFGFGVLSGFTQNNTFDHFFNSANLKTASYSLFVIDAKTGEKICESPQKSLSTASVMKLFTSAVALEYLGPDYTFTTSLAYSGTIDKKTGTLNGNLILTGGKDPAFYSAFFEDHYRDCFENWIRELKKSGIKKINGKLLIDLSALDRTTVPGGWAWDDIGSYYGAGVSALTYRDNLYEIHFSSSRLVEKLATINSLYPEIPDLSLENQVYSSTKTGDHTIVYGAPGSYHQYIEGTIPVDQTDFVVRASMPNPPLFAGQTLSKKIKENGIIFSGEVSVLKANDNVRRTLLCTQLSPPLKDLIVPLNKESLNLYAEHLLREIGLVKMGEASISKGIAAFQQYCAEKNINSVGFFPVDGSGLTRSNAFTTQTLVETIKTVYDGPHRDIFFNALPIAGVDGTLKNSFKDTPLEKNVRAKTGSMSRVRNISGTMKTKSGRIILFAVILNNFDLPSAEASKLLESILLSFYDEGNSK
jgi:D-alanyl-D-alanine carboxypeptidase/D-alanyl-D-alanine-endopeptidase (penicillin-binding protein 4)